MNNSDDNSTIKTFLTREDAARKLVNFIKDFYTGDMGDITIGFTLDGEQVLFNSDHDRPLAARHGH